MNVSLIWFFIGLGLLIAEFVIPGLIVIFFGAGAWAVALLTLIFPLGVEIQLTVFLLVAVLSLFLLRRQLLSRRDRGAGELKDELVGSMGEVRVEITPQKSGSVFAQGTSWEAVSDTTIAAGKRVRIVASDGLKLTVSPEE